METLEVLIFTSIDKLKFMLRFYQFVVDIQTRGKGMYLIDREVENALKESGLNRGLVHIYCMHTSCSLMIMENADPSARRDLEDFLDRIVPENDPHFTHTQEGSDDMPSHIKMALTRTSETIPFSNQKLSMGTWQSVFLWEHRTNSHRRRLMLSLTGE